MCFVIDSENLLINYFRKHKDKNEVSISELKELRYRIEKELNYEVYVDITGDSIIYFTCEENSPFHFKDFCIKLKDRKKISSESSTDINWRIPRDCLKKYEKIVAEA